MTMLTVTDYPASVQPASAHPASAEPASVEASLLERRTTNTDTNTDLEYGDDEHSRRSLTLAAASDDAARASIRTQHLSETYEIINRLTDQQVEDRLYTIESKRPTIFADCRRRAFDQIRKEDEGALKHKGSKRAVSCLALKYAVLHYMDDDGTLPRWLADELDWPKMR